MEESTDAQVETAETAETVEAAGDARETPPSRAGDDRSLGIALNVLGATGVVLGVALLIGDRPVGLLVLMVGVAVGVLGLDLWFLRSPDLRVVPEGPEHPAETEEEGADSTAAETDVSEEEPSEDESEEADLLDRDSGPEAGGDSEEEDVDDDEKTRKDT